jgi:MotA/TolQ/ExbB proton channel family
MLVMSFTSLHIEGGVLYMAPLSFLFLLNIGVFFYVVISLFQKKTIDEKWTEAIKQIGGLAAAWGTWSTIVGLFFAFDAIEGSAEVIPFPVICGGLKVAVITVLYGLIVYCISLMAYIILKLVNRQPHVI